MSAHPQGGYDDGYGQHGNDAYYQDEHQGYHDGYDYNNGHDYNGQNGGAEGYYDEG